jgi:hypothetical protein
MKIDLGAGELCLYDNKPFRLSAADGIVVRCVAGKLWITVQGVTEDIHLAAGQGYRIPGCGLVLIESIGNGRMRLEKSAARMESPVPSYLSSIWQQLCRSLGSDRIYLPKRAF